MLLTIEKAAKGMRQLGYYAGAITDPNAMELRTAIANFARYENVLETVEVGSSSVNVVPETFAAKIVTAANEYEDTHVTEDVPLERETETTSLVNQASAAFTSNKWLWWALLGFAGLLLVGGFVAWARSKDES